MNGMKSQSVYGENKGLADLFLELGGETKEVRKGDVAQLVILM